MQLGAYVSLRVAMNLFPDGFQLWSTWIAGLGVSAIGYAAAAALQQRDLKFVIGYSSVSHMGFILLGLATANALGLGGAVLQMFSHGIIGALLFAIAGRTHYARTHTRGLDHVPRMKLGRGVHSASLPFVHDCRAPGGGRGVAWVQRAGGARQGGGNARCRAQSQG